MSGKGFVFTVLGVVASIALTGCATSTPVQSSAVLGSMLGAATGAVIGNQSGNAGEGALIGAGAGALMGAIAGDSVRQRQQAYAMETMPPPAPGPQRVPAPRPAQPSGRWENRMITSPSGERYEQRVWVPGG